MGPLHRRALLLRGFPDPLAHLAQVAQVVLAVLVHLGLGLAAAAPTGEHADGRDHHHDREHQEQWVALAVAGGEGVPDHSQHGDDHHDWQDLLHDVARQDPGHLGWRFQMHLTAGHRRCAQPR